VESLPPAHASRRLRAAIELGVETTGHGEVEVWIRDIGPGIPADRLRHLFDSFYTSKPHGMGLGLSISRSIVEAHGGRIRCENNADAGARFEITLPPFSDTAG
jgi:signal transduction histidine kinase